MYDKTIRSGIKKALKESINVDADFDGALDIKDWCSWFWDCFKDRLTAKEREYIKAVPGLIRELIHDDDVEFKNSAQIILKELLLENYCTCSCDKHCQ